MIFLLNCAIKVTLILFMTLVFVRVLRKQSAAFRHCVLAAGILSAAITPGLSILIPGWTWNVVVESPAPVPAPVYSAFEKGPSTAGRRLMPMPLPRPTANPAGKREQVFAISQAAVAPLTQKSSLNSLNAVQGLALLWVTGFGVSLAILLFGYAHLLWITRGSRPLNSEVWTRVAEEVARKYGLTRSPRLLQNDNLSVLFTWGWRRPRILVPDGAPSWPIERIHAVLCHELAHARRGDWLVQMTAELVRAVYWFNPLLWVACRRLRCESEQACDDAALNSGITGSDYAAHVLDVVKSLRQPRRSWSYALSMAGPSTLEQRFVAMLNPAANRQTLTRVSVAAILCGFFIVTLPLSVLRGAAASAEPALALLAGRGAPVPEFALQATPLSADGIGVVQGIVRRNGSGEPIPGVEISLDGGAADQKLVDMLVRGVANAGVVFKPKRLGTVDELLQDALDAGGAAGQGPGFPRFQDAINSFQIAASARFTTVSDKDGRFTIRNVPSGEYRVHPGREEFFEEIVNEKIPRVNVTSNQASEVTVFMTAGGVMSGRVVDSLGRPVQDATVDALVMTYDNGYPVLRTFVTKTTDDQGEFRLFWLLPGEYYIQVTAPPRPNAQALLAGANGPQVALGNPRTFYPGTIDVGGATPISVRSDDKLSGLDIQMKTISLAKLSGVVTTTIPADEIEKQGQLYNPTLARPTIMLVSRDPNKPDVTGGGARVIGTVTLTNGTGKFETQGVAPGSYILFARMPQSNASGGAGFAFGRVNVDVGNEDIGGLSIAVDHMVNVGGRVTVDGRPPQNVPARVTLRVDDSSMKLGIYATLSTRYVAADANGAFNVIGVQPGPYHVDVGPGLPDTLYVADVRQGARSVFDSGFAVASDAPEALQVALSSGAGKVEGTVIDSSGKPVGGATVVLAPPENRRQNRVLFHQVITDKSGRFTMLNVAPGGYKLFSWQQPLPPSTWFNAGFMSRYEVNGRSVNVAQASTVTQQITVIP